MLVTHWLLKLRCASLSAIMPACVFAPAITVGLATELKPQRKRHRRANSSAQTCVRKYEPYAWGRSTFPIVHKCVAYDRHDGNVFNSVRAKWSSGTARIVFGIRTGETSSSAAAKPSSYGGADATTARGWRACSAEARSHEWTVLFTAGASRYFFFVHSLNRLNFTREVFQNVLFTL